MSEKPNKKRKNSKNEKATKATKTKALLVLEKPKKPREIRISNARRLFLEAYERTFGNISASAEIAGVNRVTVYRWLNSNSRVNQRFRKKLELIKPRERRKDFIEAAFMQLVAEGVPSVVIHGAKTDLRDRGLGEPLEKETPDAENEELKKLRAIIENRAAQEGVSYEEMLKVFNENYRHLYKPEVVEKLVSEANN